MRSWFKRIDDFFFPCTDRLDAVLHRQQQVSAEAQQAIQEFKKKIGKEQSVPQQVHRRTLPNDNTPIAL